MATKPDRLEDVWSVLTNPKRQIRSIQTLAAEHGFDDLVEFNRLFRERYGVSAADIRRGVRKRKVRVAPRQE
jgi:transcriptional regulator GlxA family with amidase domain